MKAWIIYIFLFQVIKSQDINEEGVWEQLNVEDLEFNDTMEDMGSTIPEDVLAKLKILNDSDYCVIKKPQLKTEAKDFAFQNYKQHCKIEQEIEKTLYEGSGVMENGINFFIEVLIGGEQYKIQVNFLNYDKFKGVFHKEFVGCKLLEDFEKHDLASVQANEDL